MSKNLGTRDRKAERCKQSWSIDRGRFLSRLLVTGILAASVFLLCCDLQEVPDSAIESMATIRGRVKDATTNLGIANVSVRSMGAAPAMTDAQGFYEVRALFAGTFPLIASKKGYNSAAAVARVGKFSAAVSEIYLTPLGDPVVVGPEGGVIKLRIIEDWCPESADECEISLDIPEGALVAEKEITLTHLRGLDIVFQCAPLPEGCISIATVKCEPEGTKFKKPAKLTVPLPFEVPPETEFPLFRYDYGVKKWKDTEKMVIAGNEGLTVDTEKAEEIEELGTYSVVVTSEMLEIEFKDPETIDIETVVSEDCTIEVWNTLSIDCPDIPVDSIVSMVEQSLEISFSEPTIISVPDCGGKITLYKDIHFGEIQIGILGLKCKVDAKEVRVAQPTEHDQGSGG